MFGTNQGGKRVIICSRIFLFIKWYHKFEEVTFILMPLLELLGLLFREEINNNQSNHSHSIECIAFGDSEEDDEETIKSKIPSNVGKYVKITLWTDQENEEDLLSGSDDNEIFDVDIEDGNKRKISSRNSSSKKKAKDDDYDELVEVTLFFGKKSGGGKINDYQDTNVIVCVICHLHGEKIYEYYFCRNLVLFSNITREGVIFCGNGDVLYTVQIRDFHHKMKN